MSESEKAVMTDCYRFLERFDQPPAGDAEEWWAEAAGALRELGVKHRNHPLALAVGVGVYEYLEEKWKAINRKRGNV